MLISCKKVVLVNSVNVNFQDVLRQNISLDLPKSIYLLKRAEDRAVNCAFLSGASFDCHLESEWSRSRGSSSGTSAPCLTQI